MSFTTLSFALFFPGAFAAYWLLRTVRGQNRLLLGASYLFYGWWDWRFCGLLFATSLIDFLIAGRLAAEPRPRARRAWLWLSVTTNLSVLGFFKYYGFFADSVRDGFAALGLEASMPTLSVVLPVGISFYTFQSLSYVVDVYRGRLEPAQRATDYLVYVAFFPQLVAGPIERGSHLLPQFLRPRRFDPDWAAEGGRLILWGLVQKLVLADNLGRWFVDPVYDAPEGRGTFVLAFATACFAFQIYCDFAGYSNIAIGLSRTLGFDLMRNFAYPYFSRSPAEFWRRWHISLSTWFRDYLYIPLGGNRCGPGRRAFNLLFTFLISGLWHGPAWTFLVWGGLNGLGVLPALFTGRSGGGPEEPPAGRGWLPSLADVAKMGGTFAFICLTWVFFRSASFDQAAEVLAGLARPESGLEELKRVGTVAGYWSLLLAALLVGYLGWEWVARTRPFPLSVGDWPVWLRWPVYTALGWLIVLMYPQASGAFIYFQF